MADIESTANPRLKSLVRLRQRRERDASGTFLIDGTREVERALRAAVDVEALYICPGPDGDAAVATLVEQAGAAGVPVIELAPHPFRKAAYGDRDRGALAVARQFGTGLDGLRLPAVPLLLVVEGIEKPGNLGAMVRTAAAAAVDAVLVADPTTDVFNPNVIRASLGALFDVQLAVAEAARVRTWLQEASIPWVASSVAGKRSLWSADFTGPVAVVVGSEDLGLTDGWLDDKNQAVRIPTDPRQASLNAALAAGLLVFEAMRQRRTAAQRGW